MLLSEKKVSYHLQAALNHEGKKNVPAWIQPVVDHQTQQRGTWEQIGEDATNAMVSVTHASTEQLGFKKTLLHTVDRTHQVATAIEEMANTASQVSEYGEHAREHAEKTAERSAAGEADLDQLINRLESVEAHLEDVGAKLKTFVERTSQIHSLTDSVTSFAEQTNLLALNAAIEAARAGEHGRGFAVVAEEVRSLANRSGETSRQIEELIGTIQNQSKVVESGMTESLDLLQQTGSYRTSVREVIRDAAQDASETLNSTEQIATAATEQSSVAAEMAESVQRISSDMDTLNESFGRLNDSNEKAKTSLTRVMPELAKHASARMTLTLGQYDHARWVDRLIQHLTTGASDLKESEVLDHHQCRLGRFLDNQGRDKLSGLNGFTELVEEAHPKVHELGRRLWKLSNTSVASEDDDSREEISRELVHESTRVIALLDKLAKQL